MRIAILIGMMLLPGWMLAQQLPAKSLFAENGFIWNPAMTGVWNYFEVGATYQRQWIGYEGAPETAHAFVQVPLIKQHMSFGASVQHDRAGLLEQNMANVTYAYRLRPGLRYRDQLSIGLGVNLTQLRWNGQEAIARQPDDPLFYETGLTALSPNVSAGLFYATASGEDYYNDFVFGGIAVTQAFPMTAQLEAGANRQSWQQVLHGHAMIGARFSSGTSYLEPALWLDYSASNVFHVTARLKFDVQEVFWGAIGYSTDHSAHLNAGFTIRGALFDKGALRVGALGQLPLGPNRESLGLTYAFYTAYRLYLQDVLGGQW